ncbi:MAG: branched-chain amino acid ABC transporter permease [Candidatus Caldarchaeum sp.]|uniref:Branched-chain amino acid ABC transporter permease n=1 Tax=Caldiarchaeum subterraneum TaxID=311458 RepID=A0A7C5QC40_CALS0
MKDIEIHWTALAVMGVVLASFPQILPPYYLTFISYLLIYSIIGLSVNLLLRNAGLVSIGHAAFFTVGAYTVAALNVYMGVFSVDLLILAGLIASAAASLLIGSVSCRHTRLYFAILTVSLAEVIHVILHWVYGASGLALPLVVSDEKTTLLWISFSRTSRLDFLRNGYYYYILGCFLASAAFLYLVQRSPLSITLNASKQNEERLISMGTDIYRLRTISFTISGTLTGLAGALWTPLSGLVDPHMIHWDISIQYLAYAVVGGSSFLGPVLGAFIVNASMEVFTIYTLQWRFLLGLFLVCIVLLLKGGISDMLVRIYTSQAKPSASKSLVS